MRREHVRSAIAAHRAFQLLRPLRERPVFEEQRRGFKWSLHHPTWMNLHAHSDLLEVGKWVMALAKNNLRLFGKMEEKTLLLF